MTVADRFLTEKQAPLTRLEDLESLLAFGVHKPQGIALKRYLAHYVSKASWFGARILAGTISPESPTLVDLFLTLFSVPGTSGPHATMIAPASDLFAKTQGVSEEAFGFFMDYAVHVLNNMGNFKSFGDTKFIPRLSPTDFEKILKASARSVEVLPLFAKVKDVIYTSDPEASLLIGYPADHHVSGYYDGPVSKDDVDFVQGFLNKQAISELNTRLFKKEDGSFEVWIASAEKSGPKTHTYEGKTIHVSKGDFAREMSAITENMAAALPFVANENQKNMVTAYVESFKTGSIDAHKESQRHWIRDVGPVVETNIGFIETYRDPAGVRAEWEGFVAVVNKEMTKKFEALVNGASAFIARLPWPKEFEKDSFLKPDFTSLEVLTFATSGSPPAGINIPNYDDIRQTFGFKNVSLGNILSAKAAKEKVTFLLEKDVPLYEKYRGEAFEVQVGIHELLGHGSGKLLAEETPGKFNFDKSSPPLSPLTGKPIETWYKPGETWGSVFKSCAASYEECRAELVAMFLCVDREILSIFGHKEIQVQDDIIFICYLNMARAGLMGLEFYDPKSRKWGQAHMQARYAILQALIKSGCVTVIPTGNSLILELDRPKILSHGLPEMTKFLLAIQTYKATADAATGVAFYDKVTSVSEEWGSKYRDIVLKEKQPRKIFVQGNTFIEGDDVVLKEYPLTNEGLIQSFVERSL